MRLSNLAGRLKAFGFDVVEHPGWPTRGYKARDLPAVRGVVWHHTGTPMRAGQSDYATAGYIMTGGTFPPWAQLGIGRTGRVHMLAAGLANHAGKGSYPGLSGNSDTIGVEVETPGTAESVTDEQRATIRRLARALTVIYDIPADTHHIRHGDWATPRGRKTDIAGVSTASIRLAAADPTTLDTEDDDMSDAQYASLLAEIKATREQAAAATIEARTAKAGVGRLEAGGVGRQVRDVMIPDPAAGPEAVAPLGRVVGATRLNVLDGADENRTTKAAVGRLESSAAQTADLNGLVERIVAGLSTLPQGTVRVDPEGLKAVVADALRERDARAANVVVERAGPVT